MRALVTGAGGFCGTHLVRRLRQEKRIEIAGIGRGSQPRSADLDRYFQADITDAEAVARAIKQFNPDLLFHLAGVWGNSSPVSRIFEVNLLGTIHVVEAIREFAPRCRVLIAGSAAEYGPIAASMLPLTEDAPCQPVGPYAISKYAATLMAIDHAHRYGLRICVVRPFNIIGPGVPESLVVGALLARLRQAVFSGKHPVVRVGDPSSKRDFVAVEDAVDAYVRLAELGTNGEIFNVCSARPYSVWRVANLLSANSPRKVSLKIDLKLVPISPARVVYGSYRKAKRAVGFRPSTSLETTLRNVWNSAIGPTKVTVPRKGAVAKTRT